MSEDQEEESNIYDKSDDFDETEYIASTFFNQIASLNLPKYATSQIFEFTKEFTDSLLNLVNNTLAINKGFDNDSVNLLEIKTCKLKSEFEKFNSIYKINKTLRKNIVVPKEIVIGHRTEQIFNSETKTYFEKNVPSTFMYIPILETLNKIVNDEFTKQLIFRENKNLEPNILYDLCDGSYLQNHPLFTNQSNLQIQLYFDEFETTNPLGSKTGIHKLGGLYFILRNIPPYLNACLKNIYI